ncbi:MAG: tetratricopeptide repeat protein, partial [Armatimonadota bacterium]|nr:tetratricopeptide repeat protein [Armatimonadota bacterium]
ATPDSAKTNAAAPAAPQPATPQPAAPQPAAPQPTTTAQYALLIVDSLTEAATPLVFESSGRDELAAHEAAATIGAAAVQRNAQSWPDRSVTDRAQLAAKYLADARASIAQGDMETAQDQLNQVLSLDPTRSEARALLGDILQSTDPVGAAAEFRRMVDLKPLDGETWAKLAIAYALSTPPDLPRAVDAGNRALKLQYDSAALRQALATVQWGRAEIFRQHDRIESAEEAEREAKDHLNRAMELAPTDDPIVLRLISKQLVTQGRYREAVESLDRIARQYPNDVEIQKQYATALSSLGGRNEEAFVAWARVWKLSGERLIPLDLEMYMQLMDGFDRRLANIGKTAAQLTTGVANRAVSKEQAVLQMSRLAEDIETAEAAIKIVQPPDQIGSLVHSSRIYAADLIHQAVGAHQLYLETDQNIYRVRATESHRQAILSLNAARTTVPTP